MQTLQLVSCLKGEALRCSLKLYHCHGNCHKGKNEEDNEPLLKWRSSVNFELTAQVEAAEVDKH